MKIVRFNEKGNCQFVYFDWRRLRFQTSCWAEDVGKLFGPDRRGPRCFFGFVKREK